MFKKGKDRARRVRNLVGISAITAIVLSVSTYAWFIGMRTVNVTSFDVEVKTTDSLMLSLNGTTWSNTITISEATLNDVSYSGHTNRWSQLIPMSTVGDVDLTASRLKLFEKASYTATPGGYRLLASRVNNYDTGKTEQDGYVAFDLFVRNFSGTQYIEDYNPLDEEAIYLTTDSKVAVATNGSQGVSGAGIENSVRVAFAQIGRVIGTSMDGSKITGIECTALDTDGKTPTVDENGVTGICTSNRPAQIWEPNDTDHDENAIRWYQKSCLKRTDLALTEVSSYSGSCATVEDTIAYPTYAIRNDIKSSDRVDIYDGTAYNGFTHPTDWLTDDAKLLQSYPYFTDTMKDKTGTERPTFMTLAPNSVTKIRVYIYIEGQDIDNYNFSAIGKAISVAFGFTKERFEETDISYNGPDTTNPVITLKGANPLVINKDDEFVDPGFDAIDNRDTETVKVQDDVDVTGTVNTAEVGTYYIKYNVADAAGNTANEVTRTVIVK